MKLVLPYPPTANLYWRVFRGRAVKSQDARRYQTTAALLATQQRSSQGHPARFSGPVALTIRAFRPRRIGDLDNLLKVAIDALKGIAFADDSQVVAIRAERHDDAKNPRLEIDVEAA